MSVDLIPPDTIVINKSPTENMDNSTDQNPLLTVTSVNIREVIGKYYTPTISESSKGVVVTFVPNGHSGPEAIIWFENAKKGFRKQEMSNLQVERKQSEHCRRKERKSQFEITIMGERFVFI